MIGRTSFPRIFSRDLAAVLVVFFLSFLFLIVFGDHLSFEEDALSLIEGSVNFDWLGRANVYRYAYQPLVYEANAALASFFSGGIRPLEIMAFAAGALGLTLLAMAVRCYFRKSLGWFSIIGSIWLVQELVVTGLYFNSMVFGLPFFSGALLLIVRGKQNERQRELWGAGVLFAFSCLCRIDYLLAFPFLTWFTVYKKKQRRLESALAPGGAAGLVFLLALGAGILRPIEIGNAMHEHEFLLHGLFEWHRGKSFWVIFSSLNVIVWYLFAAGGSLWLFQRRPARTTRLLGVLCWLLPAVWVYPRVTSPKYLVPLFAFLPFLLGWVLIKIQREFRSGRGRFVQYVPVFAVVVLTFLSVEPLAAAPYLILKKEPFLEPTHDGPRPWGSYISFYRNIRNREAGPHSLYPLKHTRSIITAFPENFVLLYYRYNYSSFASEWNFGWLALLLEERGFRISRYEYPYRIELERKGQKVQMLRLTVDQVDAYEAPEGWAVLRMPDTIRNQSPRPLMRFYLERSTLRKSLKKKYGRIGKRQA